MATTAMAASALATMETAAMAMAMVAVVGMAPMVMGLATMAAVVTVAATMATAAATALATLALEVAMEDQDLKQVAVQDVDQLGLHQCLLLSRGEAAAAHQALPQLVKEQSRFGNEG